MVLTKLMESHTEDSLTDIASRVYHEYDLVVARDLMKAICLNSPSTEIQKTGMEYLYMNGYFRELDQLIEKNRESINPSNRLWGNIYRLMLDLFNQRTSPDNTLHYLDYFIARYTIKEPEITLLIKLIRETCFYYKQEYRRLGDLIATYETHLEKVEERILVNFFKVRIYRFHIVFHMARNELIMARKYAYKALNINDSILLEATIHSHLGLSYTFDAYEKGMYHLKKAQQISQKHNISLYEHRIENNFIPFLSGKFKEVDKVQSLDKAEQAHLEVARGDYDKALELLETVNIETPLQRYYLGLAKQDKDILIQSYNEFILDNNDFFYSRLPLEALDLSR
ncbi:AimR family lysis-lysogeny pheromone receptor [Oceanobacillus sp. 1P07AA]|uniref:AimR family lysis-lysogeny pheromone receptor n=1 Tax=Oceanobacillus sp. 1P07AA TaxID=3132293 RepID=UPI0039A6940E